MAVPGTPSAIASDFPWWLAPAAIGLLALGGALMWFTLDATPEAPHEPLAAAPPSRMVRQLPPPPGPPEGKGVHWVGYGVENGAKVVYVQAVPTGDVLVVDAATGRLLETRPSVATR